MVLATLHTNDASSAITRLADMGVEPYLLATSLLGVLAQRLVRTLCPQCRRASAPTAGEQRLLDELGLPADQQVTQAAGCAQCNQSGFSGRTGIYELLRIDETLRRLIHDGAGEMTLRDAATRAGMQRLRRDGARLINDGSTSLAELTRVTREQ
jgi:general secretion pathway protein E